MCQSRVLGVLGGGKRLSIPGGPGSGADGLCVPRGRVVGSLMGGSPTRHWGAGLNLWPVLRQSCVTSC